MSHSDEAPDYNFASGRALDYNHISKNIEEAIEHLQDILNHAKANSLTESWLRIRLADAMIHFNSAYNLRYPENHAILTLEEAHKLPIAFVKEWGYAHRLTEDFTTSAPG